jgi:uncharacterized membrane protein
MSQTSRHLAGLAVALLAQATQGGEVPLDKGRMPCAYEPLVVPYIPGVFMFALDINENSEVCGYLVLPLSSRRPFYWSAAKGIDVLPLPPGFVEGEAHGICEEGDIVGIVTRADGGQFPAAWRQGVGQQLPTPLPGYGGEALAIAAETAVGWWGSFGFHALRWDEGVVASIVLPVGPNSAAWDIAEGSLMTGWMGVAWTTSSVAFLATREIATSLGTVPGGINGYGVAVNSLGDVLISGRIMIDGVPRLRSFLWSKGQFIDIGLLPDCHSMRAHDLNVHSAIVGVSEADVLGPGGPVIWHDGMMRRLRDLYNDPPHAVSPPYAINDKWEITGGSSSVSELVILRPVFGSPADVTGDCAADSQDLLILIDDWGASDSPADFNGNGIVNVTDLLFLLAHWS